MVYLVAKWAGNGQINVFNRKVGVLFMELLEKLYELKNDLKEKRELLDGNSHSLKMFEKKDMPLAIYDYVIERLEGMEDEDK